MKMDAEGRETMRDLVERGKTNRQIAEVLNVCERTVERHRVREGLKNPQPPTSGHHASPERIQSAALMVADGASWHEIMRTLGMKRETLERHFPGTAWTKSEGSRFRNEKARLERLVERMTA